mmetsp:Transcript_52022/g.123061  ORF Transcript_52022/g.123061 Transcript_52022/m.123061 type:complete len:283 (+) Transcript_52022:916-1764(+)
MHARVLGIPPGRAARPGHALSRMVELRDHHALRWPLRHVGCRCPDRALQHRRDLLHDPARDRDRGHHPRRERAGCREQHRSQAHWHRLAPLRLHQHRSLHRRVCAAPARVGWHVQQPGASRHVGHLSPSHPSVLLRLRLSRRHFLWHHSRGGAAARGLRAQPYRLLHCRHPPRTSPRLPLQSRTPWALVRPRCRLFHPERGPRPVRLLRQLGWAGLLRCPARRQAAGAVCRNPTGCGGGCGAGQPSPVAERGLTSLSSAIWRGGMRVARGDGRPHGSSPEPS